MSLRLGNRAPDFHAQTTQGPISFHEWLGTSYGVLFSHPKDFTPACATELGYLARRQPEFSRRNVKVIGLSVDAVSDHARWLASIRAVIGSELAYPIVSDHALKVAALYDLLPAAASDSYSEGAQGRTAATNPRVRTVFIIGPGKLIKAYRVYPQSAGRHFDDVLRLIDSIQLTATHTTAMPSYWKLGRSAINVAPIGTVATEETYPAAWMTVNPYPRVVALPGADLSG
jgi:alkyl hydroperoxide reductase subunit AhpC